LPDFSYDEITLTIRWILLS